MDRRSIVVSGIVQGVGFRPFVFDLAVRLGLVGSVKNRSGDVLIELEGEPGSLDRFLSGLTTRPPPMARIDEVRWAAEPPRGESRFRIEPSESDRAGPIFVATDAATCDDCLRELFDPDDRRHRYPFLNCTHCGPRLTIVRDVPYDRERTTMASFAMCPACRSEYENPADRRYHAQPIACRVCGPRLRAIDPSGRDVPGVDPLDHAVDRLRAGAIVAIKGLGGYHLACLADDEHAVAELRRRKHRDAKPMAVLVADLAAASRLATIDDRERTLLASRRRPIVLLDRRPAAPIAEGLAPRNPTIGVMLAYTPLHHLILDDLGGRPVVMTSGNRSDEPIAYDDRDAVDRLGGIADLILANDRPIERRCDDSVTRVVLGVELPIRRSRGHAPEPIDLPIACGVPTLAMGGQLKAVFALGRGRHAFLSHHLGDLDHYEAFAAYAGAIDDYLRLFAIEPGLIVHDLHPDYASTRLAIDLAGAIPRLAVQHHHAHLASCMADNGLDEPVIGVTFDGSGFGEDGAIWGGEFLTGDYRGFRRAAHLRYVAMPGGEQAVREPWRMAVAYLEDAGQGDEAMNGRVAPASLSIARRLIDRGLNAPKTSSMGRLFDAVAALAGVRDRVGFEGQAAMEFEGLAARVAEDGAYPFAIEEAGGPLVVDPRPMIAEVAAEVRRGASPAAIGRRFHSTVVAMIAEVCGRIRTETGLDAVVLSGGVFLNALLLAGTVDRLERDGFRVHRHRRVPPGDGGLCLGQIAIAAARSI